MKPERMHTPFDDVHDNQTLTEALEATVRCARQIPFWRDHLPAREIRSLNDFDSLPLSSRADISMARGLGDLISDPRWIFRSTYPYHQNVCTFPFQVVAGEADLFIRHERMKAILEAAGFPSGGESLILVTPPQFFFASDLCAEIFFEGHHCSIQDVTGMGPAEIRERIDVLGAEMVIVATQTSSITPEAFPQSVKAIVTFRGEFPELSALDARIVDVYNLTEAPYVGHRIRGEQELYSYNPDHYYVERSPNGLVTVTTLLWEVMPLIRYQTYDCLGELRDHEGRVEITRFGEW